MRCGLHHAAAQEVSAGIEEVRGDGEQPAQGHRLLAEDGQGQGVALLAVVPDPLGRLAQGQAGDRVAFVLGQPVRQQVLLDPGERGHALRVAPLAAVTAGRRLTRVQQAVQRDRDMAEFAGHPGRALDHPAGLDQAAAQAGAHDRGH